MARLTSITSKSQVPPKDHAIVDSIVQSRGAVQGPFTMFLHCPELGGRLAHLGAFVRFEGSLDMRVRVLAAMTVARELDAVYVWGAQTGQARKLGVPEATIAAVREKHSRGLPPEDAQIVDFTRTLLRQHRVDDASVKALRARFGDDGFIQLTGAIGYYSMLCMTVNACELEAARVHRHAQHAVVERAMLIVDAQIHLWNAGKPTNPNHRQIAAYTKDDALKEMDAAGVDA